MKTSVIGFPRIGATRELKFAIEKYFKGQINQEQLNIVGGELRKKHWQLQKNHQINFIPSNDFSLYDQVLDTAFLFNIVPARYRNLQLNEIDTYFAMARGYQGEQGDVKALTMKKWFNTNYHYMVPEIDNDTNISLVGTKIFEEYLEAQQLGIETTPVLIGPYTLLKLTKFSGEQTIANQIDDVVTAYQAVIAKLEQLGANWLQLDEPYLVTELQAQDLELVQSLYDRLLACKTTLKVNVQTYFGDIRESYTLLQSLPIDGIGLDFVEGSLSLELIKQHGFSADKILFAGVVNGKNIWRNNYETTFQQLEQIQEYCKQIVVNTSCSLLHVPYSIKQETVLTNEISSHFAFAVEKLEELAEIKQISNLSSYREHPVYIQNNELHSNARFNPNQQLATKLASLNAEDFTRLPAFAKREQIQKEVFQLPNFPTTTIGSFPQTEDVRANRAAFKKGKINEAQYKQFNLEKISRCIAKQEEIGLDVLVHGEYERNDMVEYFGESLEGFIFTQYAWVQSYGTRCVKPPIIWSDITRKRPITVEYSVFANSLTEKHVKAMLTGPVTILNWSFPREDISLSDIAYQIALAIREEVLDLEANGIKIIQIDEAALREKLPLRKSDWDTQYLNWAIPAFRLVHSGVQAETQIHTHMCYSQFSDIIKEIDAMDADVISFEASRSDLSIIDDLHANNFQTQVGPGVYDIHSPRIPSVEELVASIERIYDKVPVEKLWINPDCGLKTRGELETWATLQNLIEATTIIRNRLS